MATMGAQRSWLVMADTGPTVMRYRRYSTPAEGQPRTLDVDKSRTAFGEPLIDTALAQARATVTRSFPRSVTRESLEPISMVLSWSWSRL